MDQCRILVMTTDYICNERNSPESVEVVCVTCISGTSAKLTVISCAVSFPENPAYISIPVTGTLVFYEHS